jgi:hypothetical protein
MKRAGGNEAAGQPFGQWDCNGKTHMRLIGDGICNQRVMRVENVKVVGC